MSIWSIRLGDDLFRRRPDNRELAENPRAVIDAAACAGAFRVPGVLARTLHTLRALHDNATTVIETHTRALALCTFRFHTMRTKTRRTLDAAHDNE